MQLSFLQLLPPILLTGTSSVADARSYRARRWGLSAAALLLFVCNRAAWATAIGLVDFENFSTSAISINSVHNGPPTGFISGPPGSYYFELLSAFPTTTSIDATLDNGTNLDQGGWVTAAGLGTNTGTPGLMSGNITSDPAVDVFAYQSSLSFAVVGWSANIGTTYSQAKAWWNDGNPASGPSSGYFAISNVAQDVLLGGGPVPIPDIFGPTPTYQVQGFTLNYYSIGPTWDGAHSGTWDIATTANFSGSAYTDGSVVTFGDHAANLTTAVQRTSPINIVSGGVRPSSVTFNNNAATYRFTTSGTTGIGGSGNVAITGGGTVIFASPNTYSGGTTISTGTLKAAPNSLLSTGPLTIGTTGKLYIGDPATDNSVPTGIANPLITGNETWAATGSYLPKVDGGSNGPADLLSIGGGTGALTLSGEYNNTFPFYIVPQPGDVALGSTSENWEIASFGSIAGYLGSYPSAPGLANGIALNAIPPNGQFVLDTSAFSAPSSDFSLSLVELSPGHDAIYLSYSPVPEPSSVILFLGGAPLLLRRKRGML